MEHLGKRLECTYQDVEVSIHTSLFGRNERRHWNLMFSWKPQPASAEPPLSSGDLETLGEIRSDLELQGKKTSLSDAEIIDLAMRLMRRDIDRGLETEVFEELWREADYRQWCASIDGMGLNGDPAGSLREDGDSK